jgi:GntR family transcriptional regulator / MocR family aminotransferase
MNDPVRGKGREPVLPFDLQLPARGEGARVQALHQQLRAAVLDRRLLPGATLPATRRLAAAYGLARNTVVAAYDLLVAEGYVLPRPQARAVVAELAAGRGRGRVRTPPRGSERPRDDAAFQPVWQSPVLLRPAARVLPARSFRLGVPEHLHFPAEVWRRLSARELRRWAQAPFDYPPTEGLLSLRDAIARHVAFTRAVACSADDVIVTRGAQQAVDLLARLLVTPGRTRVAVEEPGYPPVRAAFAAAGAVLVPVPVDDEGLCVDRLPADVRVISVTPSHQSPTGVRLSQPRRAALLDFAQRRGAVVIEDDYDGEFRFGARPLDALQTQDRDDSVCYVGTFSKSLFPALRQGFVVAPPWLQRGLLTVKRATDAHADALAQAVLAAFIAEGHLARHVRRMQPVYAARRQVLLQSLQTELADWLTPIPSEAGLHLAAAIRQPRAAERIVQAARVCTPGAQSTNEYAMAPLPRPALAFGYGVMEVDAIPAAMRCLRRQLEGVSAAPSRATTGRHRG